MILSKDTFNTEEIPTLLQNLNLLHCAQGQRGGILHIKGGGGGAHPVINIWLAESHIYGVCGSIMVGS